MEAPAVRLFGHQSEAIERAKKGNLALWHEPGCGKTLSALQIIRHWRVQGQGPALVVCPLSIIESAWMADCRRFTPELSITSLWAKTTAERREWLRRTADIYVINFEGFRLLYPEIADKQFGTIIVDESSKMKNPKSQVAKALLSLAGVPFHGSPFKTSHVIPHRYVLSGTPSPNDESEYWTQIKFITGPGHRVFHDNYFSFRSTYFYGVPIGTTGQTIWKFRTAMRDQFQAAMRPMTHVVRKVDCLELPEQTHVIRTVYLSPAERTAYDTFKRSLVLRFGDEMLLGQTALTECMKLRQLASGFGYSQSGATIQTGHSKLDELQDLLDEIGSRQVIIWANFKAEIEQLMKALPDAVALWSGSTDREGAIAAFRDGRAQYLIANPQSAGHGLTFTNCCYAIYFSLSYSYELMKQSQDRIHRIGQRHPCTYFYLLAEKTIDPVIYQAVSRKADLSNATLQYLKGGSRANRQAIAV